MTGRRIAARIALAVGAVLGLAVLLVWFGFSSPWAAKRIIAFALGKSAAGLTIAEVEGPLRGPLVLKRIRYRSGGVSALVDSVYVDWKPAALVHRRVELERLEVTGLKVVMSDSAPPDSGGTGSARRERPTPPLEIVLGDATVRGIDVDAFDNLKVTGGMVRLTGTLERYRFTLTGTAVVRKVPRLPALTLRTTGIGGVERLTIERAEGELLDGRIRAAGTVKWWPAIGWDLAVDADQVRPGLMLEDSTTLRGRITAFARTSGTVDSAGPEGRVTVDSSRGTVNQKPVHGTATMQFAGTRYRLDGLDGYWGPVRARASGQIGDTLDLVYGVEVAELRGVMESGSGSVSARGTAKGPVAEALVHAELSGRGLGVGSFAVGRVSGRADVGLSPRGRTDVDLRGDSAAVGVRSIGTVTLAVRGVRPAHRLSARVMGAVDSVIVGVAGALTGKSWSGRIDTMRVVSQAAGQWVLQQSVAVTASPIAAHLDTLCLAADSGGGRACAGADWHGGPNWSAGGRIDGVPLVRLAAARLDPFTGGRAAFRGTLGVVAEARSTPDRLDATIRATSDTVAFIYRDKGDSVERRLTLDSAVANLSAGQRGLAATLGIRVLDHAKKEVVVLSGHAAVPEFQYGKPTAGLALTASLDGKIDSLSFARPLLAELDSLAGSMLLSAKASGTLDAPEIDADLTLERLMAATRGTAVVRGAVVANLKGGATRGVLHGEATVTPRGIDYAYRRFGKWRHVSVDSGGVHATAGPDGVRGALGLLVSNPDSTALGSVSVDVTLPRYTRLGTPIGPEPVTLKGRATLPNLAVFEPWVTSVDSLGGRLALAVDVTGAVATPAIVATLQVDSLAGRFPFGSRLAGGLRGKLDAKVASDSTVRGTLTLEPDSLAVEYAEGTRLRRIRFDSTSVRVDAGPDGIRGKLSLILADPDQRLATLAGALALPRYTRVGRPLRPEPIEATLTGRIADLSFVKAFTDQVDSAVGHATLDAKLDGTLGESHLTGGFELVDAAARLPVLGILLDSVGLKATGDQAGAIAVDGHLSSGGGRITIKGSTPVQPTSATPGRIAIEGERFEAAHTAQVHAIVSPKLRVRLAGDTVMVFGDLTLPLAAVTLSEIPEFAVAPSNDVILLDSIAAPRRTRPLAARIRLVLGDSVSFKGFNFNAKFGGSVTVSEQPNRLATAIGTLTIIDGRYRAYGQDLTIEDGRVSFAGGAVDDPGLSIRASRTAQDSTNAGIQIAGTLKAPVVTLYSTPPMSQSDILSYIVRGKPLGQGSGASGSLMDRALSSLGLRGGNMVAGAIGHEIGLEDARIETQGDFKQAAFFAGHYLSPNLYVSYGIGLFDPVSTLRLRYVLSNRFTLQAETGRETSADLIIKTEPGRAPTRP